jgi:hypothetical protein
VGNAKDGGGCGRPVDNKEEKESRNKKENKKEKVKEKKKGK